MGDKFNNNVNVGDLIMATINKYNSYNVVTIIRPGIVLKITNKRFYYIDFETTISINNIRYSNKDKCFLYEYKYIMTNYYITKLQKIYNKILTKYPYSSALSNKKLNTMLDYIEEISNVNNT